MSREERRSLEAWRDHALSDETRSDLRRSTATSEAWEREHPTSLASTLDWIDQLRSLFGEPPVERAPWRGDDYRF